MAVTAQTGLPQRQILLQAAGAETVETAVFQVAHFIRMFRKANCISRLQPLKWLQKAEVETVDEAATAETVVVVVKAATVVAVETVISAVAAEMEVMAVTG